MASESADAAAVAVRSADRRRMLPYQIVMAVAMGAIGGIIAVLGELRDELGFADSEIGIIVTSGFLASFIAQIALSPLADRGYGRQMAIAGTVLGGTGLLLMVTADTLTVWTVARAVLGFSTGMLMPGIRRAVTVLDPDRAGENLGRLVIGEVGGFTGGPVVAAILVEVGGIRLPFLVFAIGVFAFVPFVFRLPADTGRKTERMISAFGLLKIRRLQGALILVFGYFLLIGAFESVIPLMFTDRGGGPLETGIAFTMFSIPIVLVSTHAGKVADRTSGASVAAIGMGVSATFVALYGVVPGIWGLALTMMVIGVAEGYGFIGGQVAVSRSVTEDRQAAALGLMGAAEVAGAAVWAFPAASLYESGGADRAWFTTSAVSLVLLALGWSRIRGTAPVRRSTGRVRPDQWINGR